MILENEQVRKVTLYNKEKQAYLSLHFNAPVVGLWSPPAKNAPFVCIEPWYGRCDRAHYTGEYKDKDWMCDRITTLETHLRVLKSLAPYAAINFIRKGMGYEEYLREYAQYRKIKPEELSEILDRLTESTKGMNSLEEWESYIEEYTEKLEEQARKAEQEREGVLISTLHGVKGLEYEQVYILNVNEGSMPYRKAVLEPAIEEERRLFYVGMTRARKQLALCYVRQQYEKKREPSRFLKEAGV